MVSFEVDGFTFSLSDGENRILVFKGNALADWHNYPSREAAEADFEHIKICNKVVFASDGKNKMEPEK